MTLENDHFNDPIVRRHFGKRRWMFPGDTTVSDLGARIVAASLGNMLDHYSVQYEAHGFPTLSWLANDAAFSLQEIATGADHDTVQEERERWDALEALSERTFAGSV